MVQVVSNRLTLRHRDCAIARKQSYFSSGSRIVSTLMGASR